MAVRGHIIYVVDRLVDACICVKIATELHSDRATILDKVVSLKVIGTVEAHMFEEVSQSSLAFVFLNRTDFLRYIEVCAVFGPIVIADIVRKSVR